MLGFGHIATAESVGIPNNNRLKFTRRGLLYHSLKAGPGLGGCSTDGIVHVFADEVVSMFVGKPMDFFSLVAKGLLLSVG